MQRLLLMILFSAATVCAVSGQTCSNIRSFDLSNATIDSSSTGGSLDGHSVFHFQNGRAFLSDDTNTPQARDWELTITSNRLINPTPSTWLRVITFDRSHLTGAGNWNYVMAFTCRHGHLVRIFEYSGLYVRLMHLDTQTLVLEQGIRKRNDPFCCPTGKEQITYRWDVKTHRYSLDTRLQLNYPKS